MKYGILLNKNNLNIGDDIQAYATAQFYPEVDYFIDRESMPTFKTDDGEPVGVVYVEKMELAAITIHLSAVCGIPLCGPPAREAAWKST